MSVAVLIDNFIISSKKSEIAERKEALNARKMIHILDPLMSSLTQHYVDDADLSDRLKLLFQARLRSSKAQTRIFRE